MGGDSIRLLLREAAILFLAATALGLVYNAASPLGIELRARNAQTTTVGSHGRATYSNETLSIAPQSQRSTPPRNSRIQNETLGLAVLPSGPVAAPVPKNIPSMTWPQV